MATFPAPLARIIQELIKLPGVGEKTATRLAFHLLRTERASVDALSAALITLRNEMRLCSVCYAFTVQDPCATCSDPGRSSEQICVVEGPADVIAVDKSGQFRGRYHVLHGSLSPLDGIGPEQLRVTELLHRLRDGVVREVILATNPTVEGEATAMYVAKLIKPLGIRVTRIAHGLPMGADVEYADMMTLGKALEGRREM
jgi:recombination protein RecR